MVAYNLEEDGADVELPPTTSGSTRSRKGKGGSRGSAKGGSFGGEVDPLTGFTRSSNLNRNGSSQPSSTKKKTDGSPPQQKRGSESPPIEKKIDPPSEKPAQKIEKQQLQLPVAGARRAHSGGIDGLEATTAEEATAKDDRALWQQLCQLANGSSEVVDKVPSSSLLSAIKSTGLRLSDERIKSAVDGVQMKKEVTMSDFFELLHTNILLERALKDDLVIDDWEGLKRDMVEIYNKVKDNEGGEMASYIPQLSRQNPKHFGVAVCTIDGQRFCHGDTDVQFCIQSCSKPITYCMALEEHGQDKVHQHVGFEPSGALFNELALNSKGLPHNPMINSGAIMMSSLIKPMRHIDGRFDWALEVWTKLTGRVKPGFSQTTYLSERNTADRNFALSYMMRERGAFPEGTNLLETLELYFMFCSIELDADAFSVVAATLANGGVCPVTGIRIFDTATVRNCLSLMASSGMYDFSGEFAFRMGFPAKSGVAGAVITVIPGVMGVCTFSPRLDEHGNSVRGIEFAKYLNQYYPVHMFDGIEIDDAAEERVELEGTKENGGGQQEMSASVRSKQQKQLAKKKEETVVENLNSYIFAAANGNIERMKRLLARGVDSNGADYDGRTAMHLAASNNQTQVVKYLIEKGCDFSAKDRYGNTPLDDAKRHGHKEVEKVLSSWKSSTTVNAAAGSDVDHRYHSFFSAVDGERYGNVPRSELEKLLESEGFDVSDETKNAIVKHALLEFGDQRDVNGLGEFLDSHPLIQKAVKGMMAVRDWKLFEAKMNELYKDTYGKDGGDVARYIPQLAAVDPEQFGVAACSVDGQQYAKGDVDFMYCAQSTSKAIQYCMALELFGEEKVHKHVGVEPSGQSFNKMALNPAGLPHNPMINSGAIMTCSLVHPELKVADRLDAVMKTWRELGAGGKIGFDNATYLSEKNSADRNFCLGYMMKEAGAFPEGTDLIETLSFYFMCCSLTLNARTMSIFAATLANGGVNPLTGKRIFKASTVRNCLSIALSCGMYDYSGQFAFRMGFPAKSGVSGAVMVVIPGVMGFATFSPRLDEHGNSVRGIEFCRALGETYSFHLYGGNRVSMTSDTVLLDISKYGGNDDERIIAETLLAAAEGDVKALKSLSSAGHSLDVGDYDMRTPLHLAVCSNHVEVVEYLLGITSRGKHHIKMATSE